jgi:hypothetical protein
MEANTHSNTQDQPVGPGMDAEQLAKFKSLIKEYLEVEDPIEIDKAIDYAEHDSRFEGLGHFAAIEVELRKHDLAQIGYMFLSTIGECNHGSWDGYNREELKQFNWVLGEFLLTFQNWDPHGGSYKEHSWGFGGDEHWDTQGVRHTKES